MELNIFVSKQDLINGTRTTAHSAINHALFYDKHSSRPTIWRGLERVGILSSKKHHIISINTYSSCLHQIIMFLIKKSKYVTDFSVAYFWLKNKEYVYHYIT